MGRRRARNPLKTCSTCRRTNWRRSTPRRRRWLSPAVNALSERLTFEPGASGLLGVQQLGDDPTFQASLKSSMNLGRHVTLDADLRYVSALPGPFVLSYVELNAWIGWNVTDHVQLFLAGFNLLHDPHQELPAPAEATPRSVFAEAQWRF